MAGDPFEVQPPAWLQQIAKPVNGEELGRSFAMGLSTLATAFEEDPNGQPGERKGLSTAAAEVSNAQLDPQWRVKGQMLANQVASQKMQLAEQGAWLNAQQRETSAWMEELPSVSSYLTTPPDKLDGVDPPKVTSQRGIQAVTAKQQQIETYKLRKQQQDNLNSYRQSQEENRRFNIERGAAWQKHNQDVQEKYADLTPENRAAVDAMGPRARNKDGSFTSEAEVMINQGLKNEGKPLIGAKPSGKLSPEVQAQLTDLRADAADLRRRIAAAEKNGSDTSDLEAELDGVKEQMRGLTGGQGIAGPAGGGDKFSKQQNAIQQKIIDAKARGNTDAEKAATEELQILNRKKALADGNSIFSGKPNSTDANKIKSLKLPATIYVESAKDFFKIENENDRSAILEQFEGGPKSTPGSAALPTDIYVSRERKQARATFLREKLDKQGAAKMTESEANELNRLEEELKKPQQEIPNDLQFDPSKLGAASDWRKYSFQ